LVLWRRILATLPGPEARRTALGFSRLRWLLAELYLGGRCLSHQLSVPGGCLAGSASGGERAAVSAGTAGPTFRYFGLLFLASMPPAAVASVLLPYAILWKDTRYPRWFAACNPALLYLLATLFAWVPAPLGGLLVVGAGNMVFLVFFVCSTALLWNGGLCEGKPSESA
jgi:hypothetical protein